MKNLIISDTVLLGKTVNESMDIAGTINSFRTKGCNIVMLSNKPYKYMRPIHGEITEDRIEPIFRRASCKKGEGLPVRLGSLGPDKSWEDFRSTTICYDYSIFGCGAFIVDSKDDLVHKGACIDSETLEGMIKLFGERGYISPEQEHVSDGRVRLYNFLGYDKEYTMPRKSTYGVQCSSVNPDYDRETVSAIMEHFPGIEGFVINGKPCFYRADNNKLNAVDKLVADGVVDPSNVHLFLGDSTEERLARVFDPKQTWAIGNEGIHAFAKYTNQFAPTLFKALGKVV